MNERLSEWMNYISIRFLPTNFRSVSGLHIISSIKPYSIRSRYVDLLPTFPCHYSMFREIILGIIGHDPNVSKSNWLHVVIFGFSLLIFGIFYSFF
jgi:hypothetical protein